MKKVLLSIVAIVVLSIFGFHLYYNVYNKGYEDRNYGFLLLNTRGWSILSPREGVYMSLGTEKDGTTLSYVGISPILKSANENKNEETFKTMCDELVAENNGKFVSFKEVGIGTLNGYTCNYEIVGTNLNETLNASSIVLLGSASVNYDYIISTTFPKNNVEEQKKVETLVNSFWVN